MKRITAWVIERPVPWILVAAYGIFFRLGHVFLKTVFAGSCLDDTTDCGRGTANIQ